MWFYKIKHLVFLVMIIWHIYDTMETPTCSRNGFSSAHGCYSSLYFSICLIHLSLFVVRKLMTFTYLFSSNLCWLYKLKGSDCLFESGGCLDFSLLIPFLIVVLSKDLLHHINKVGYYCFYKLVRRSIMYANFRYSIQYINSFAVILF
jgi:hypothetical protein